MKTAIASLLLLICTVLQIPAQNTPPALRLPAIISDHMVLQAGTADPIWGWAAPQAAVTIQFIDSQGTPLVRAVTNAGADGRWSAALPALQPGVAGTLRISAGAESKDIADVLTGQTWLCGGQSNMSFSTGGVLNARHEIEQSADPQLRLFSVPNVPAMVPHDDVMGARWTLCAPGTVGNFSAVGYYFGRHLRSSLNEPVGLIGSYWGGTSAQVWTSMAALRQAPALRNYVRQYDQTVAGYPGGDAQYAKDRADYAAKMAQWNKEIDENKDYQAARAVWRMDADAAKLVGKPEPAMPPLPSPRPAEPFNGGAGVPSFLFNGMIAPLAPFAIRGAIWFQADGNMGYPQEYGLLIKTLINDWRAQWKSELAFYYVEMNNMRDYPQKVPVIYNNLSLIREQQQAALELPDTGVVCSIDVGLPVPEPHFPNKKPVGDRLALLALNDLYNQRGLVNSPAYKDFQVEGEKIRIHFTAADGLRISPGHQFAGFAIRAEGGNWVWAQGSIDGESILVWSDAVPKPAAVRYAWAANPVISIENGAGLPLRPFRTDLESPQ